MDLMPAIDIRGGRCVRLVQGDYGRETVFGDDPLAMAQRWVAQGARRLHVVDLDAAKDGRPVNAALIARIIAETGARVQVAGGPRDAAAFDRWADAGADRIVTGTLAVQQPDIVEAAARRHPGKIAAAVDARGGRVAIKGWLETSDLQVAEFIRDMVRRGVAHFIYTDISRDGTMAHPDFEAFARVLDDSGLRAEGGEEAPVIYSGGITSVGDIARLATEFSIEGVIVGRALYDGRIDLRAAQRVLVSGDDW
ncbi:MAG: 1-(5-phosphoribosyl)-5-[(5-phosphoribosylamino)methylideneamino]imidazole-4-carboxamide isomerase [Chloroflexota bacterium]|nr:1-(5-phosphoribosyl)-5-[(5-phosphoribosylamino)methylideneamino]imidazole-4-carboxamide isomerase [Chloroflexota bacterium]